ncbi:restriction modification enzyme subunit S2B [Mycoplasmopsis citelli]|uniref:Restriction modification enzyme subunit S2B n=1 Tax=Mycoplasmopsis citelli TaxID=171281 RepID=A0A449B360_9BACT|nr:restriction endonuclease subunit S [Mycoplasmopsis citelli]VEU74995.1 restriction modification enzyme subunit S2B [Mycoplasmopsis citelli]
MKYGEGNTIPKKRGVYPVYGSNGIVSFTERWNNENGIIVGHIGTVGNVVWAEGKHFVTYNGTIIKGISNIVLDKYLYYCLVLKKLEKLKKGGQPFLSISDIENTEIFIPSLKFQEKTSIFFSNFDNLISFHQRKYLKLEQIKKSLLKKMLPNDYKNTPSIRFRGFSESWKQRKLKEVIDITKGEQLNKEKMFHYGLYPVINGGTSPTGYFNKYNQEANTITIAQGGAAGYVDFQQKRFWASSHCYIIYLKNNEKISNKFLFYVLKNKEYIIRQKAYGATIMSVDKESILTLFLSLPIFNEQEKLGKFFFQLDNLITLHQRE